jgi:hypothetical protein
MTTGFAIGIMLGMASFGAYVLWVIWNDLPVEVDCRLHCWHPLHEHTFCCKCATDLCPEEGS